MNDIISAFRIAGMTYLIGILACGLVGLILFLLRKVVSKKSNGSEQT